MFLEVFKVPFGFCMKEFQEEKLSDLKVGEFL